MLTQKTSTERNMLCYCQYFHPPGKRAHRIHPVTLVLHILRYKTLSLGIDQVFAGQSWNVRNYSYTLTTNTD